MSVYAVHKIGFFYTDDSYEGYESGSVISIEKTLEAAQATRHEANIKSLEDMDFQRLSEFFVTEPNGRQKEARLLQLLTELYGENAGERFGAELVKEDADKILSLTGVTFHNIVEYENEDEIDETAFDSRSEENECEEF